MIHKLFDWLVAIVIALVFWSMIFGAIHMVKQLHIYLSKIFIIAG